MEAFRVTVIGQDLFKEIAGFFEESGLKEANQVNSGMLGNLKTLTYEFYLEENEVISKRKEFMNLVAKESPRLMGLYVHGDWMRVFVMKPLRR